MFEAKIIKATVIQTGQLPSVMGVAEYGDDMVNFKATYNWEELDHNQFLIDLRDKIAEDLDIPVYHVDMSPDLLIGNMYEHYMKSKGGLTLQ